MSSNFPSCSCLIHFYSHNSILFLVYDLRISCSQCIDCFLFFLYWNATQNQLFFDPFAICVWCAKCEPTRSVTERDLGCLFITQHCHFVCQFTKISPRLFSFFLFLKRNKNKNSNLIWFNFNVHLLCKAVGKWLNEVTTIKKRANIMIFCHL